MVKIIRRLLMKIRMKRNANAFYKGANDALNDVAKYCVDDIIATEECVRRLKAINSSQKMHLPL